MASNEETNAAGTDTRPPMLVESDYDSWKIRIHRTTLCVSKACEDMKITQLNHSNSSDEHQVYSITHLKGAYEPHAQKDSQETGASPNDALMATMTQIANLLSGFQKQFPPTNNQLRTSSNSRTHATVHDGHIVMNSSEEGSGFFNNGNTGGRGKKVICFNCRGGRPSARQCKEPKRKMDSQYFKDKALLMEAKENGDVLDAEAEAFLADVECTAPYDQPQALTTTNIFKSIMRMHMTQTWMEGPNAVSLSWPTCHPLVQPTLCSQCVLAMEKMNENQGLVRTANDFYAKLNALMFVPQKDLSGDQAYWLSANEIASQASKSATPATPFVHKSRPPSQVLASLRKLMLFFLNLQGPLKANNHSRIAYTEKLSAFTAENTKLKAQVTGTTSSGPSTSETPKVLAPGMYNLGSKYIPPPKRANWVTPTQLPKKRQVVQIVLWYLDSLSLAMVIINWVTLSSLESIMLKDSSTTYSHLAMASSVESSGISGQNEIIGKILSEDYPCWKYDKDHFVSILSARTDNGTEFVNKTLDGWFESVGISHGNVCTSVLHNTNGVCRRRNELLWNAARTCSSLRKAFHCSYGLKERNLLYSTSEYFGFLVLSYHDSMTWLNSRRKQDIGIFVGYAPTKKGDTGIYNPQKRKIQEISHVAFDETYEGLTSVQTSAAGSALVVLIPPVIRLTTVNVHAAPALENAMVHLSTTVISEGALQL
ncbi:hypothetical protein Tco_0806815 [Tanacetum coccineum]